MTYDAIIIGLGAMGSAAAFHLANRGLRVIGIDRFPVLQPASDMIAVWEPRAGILFPERCIAAHLQMAEQRGATLRFDEQVTRVELGESTVRVITNGEKLSASHVVLSCGSWLASL